MLFGVRKKNSLEDLFGLCHNLKKYHASGNLNFNNPGIFQSLKSRILWKKILPISLKLNFTPNTLTCFGLIFKNSRDFQRLKIFKVLDDNSNILRTSSKIDKFSDFSQILHLCTAIIE